ncbi:MAG: hypothetical protein MRERV_36c009 [Mycoplasmataceae bacterium RV_VA103A]|nr:MAG: hypothetical protein MRERV_36c009 [Mycoplasmataceae bacterium RV_VA103A]
MYRIDRNNYNLKSKNSSIYTPPAVSQFIYELLTPFFLPEKGRLIFDPCSGENSLLKPWQAAGYQVWGNDNDSRVLRKQIPNSDLNFLTSEKFQWDNYFFQEPILILCNPPFNGMKPKLAPEVWLDKILELFGREIPIVLFAPIGLRICHDPKSKRWGKFTNGHYPPITSIISLPRTIFTGVEFHTEILIFNIPNLQPHYFYHHEQI